MKRILIILIFLTIAVVFGLHCKKDSVTCYKDLPYIYTDTLINVYSQQFHNLEIIGGWGYIPSGYKGIFVYHKAQNEFVAWERCCTCNPNHSKAKVYYDGGFLLHDSLCGSEFLITDGYPTQSSSSPCPLLEFGVAYDITTGYLHVYNK